MIISHGISEYTDRRKKVVRYDFFADPFHTGEDAVFGMDVTLMKLVNTFKSAAYGFGTDKRIILLPGPVGSAKSTLARLLKAGLEKSTRSPDGAPSATPSTSAQAASCRARGSRRRRRMRREAETIDTNVLVAGGWRAVFCAWMQKCGRNSKDEI